MEWKRFIVFGLFLIVIWASIWVLLYLKADEVTKDPCTICSEKHGEKVFCTVGTTYPLTRTYHPNGSITDNRDEVEQSIRREAWVNSLPPDEEWFPNWPTKNYTGEPCNESIQTCM